MEYTHEFQFNFGNQDITGRVEFNNDGITSFKTDNPLEELGTAEMRWINELLRVLTALDQFPGGLTKINIEEG